MRWCNGKGHPSGCDCAFRGRECGTAKSRGMIISRRSLQTYSQGGGVPRRVSPMRQMAIDYQINLMYAAECWHCFRNVFLFADKHGGFVIFDSPGGRWPKHECEGYKCNPNKIRTASIRWGEDFDAPVPFDAPIDHVSETMESQYLEGTVISIAKKPEIIRDFWHWPAAIFTGKVVY